MTKYRESFNLKQRDIELIESALRSEISRIGALSKLHDGTAVDTHRARELNQLLAKIYHQKVFYSQVHSTGVPGG